MRQRKFNPEESVADIIRPYAGKWVALSADKKVVLGVSKEMEVALKQAHKEGEKIPHLIKVPDSSVAAYIY
ncbi:MAG: hypothetical protein KC618_00760 [Candidatus Omnitrophica bacterium]|nr:hypothetical protein [Candidatus Omnitrophota bacterium]